MPAASQGLSIFIERSPIKCRKGSGSIVEEEAPNWERARFMLVTRAAVVLANKEIVAITKR